MALVMNRTRNPRRLAFSSGVKPGLVRRRLNATIDTTMTRKVTRAVTTEAENPREEITAQKTKAIPATEATARIRSR